MWYYAGMKRMKRVVLWFVIMFALAAVLSYFPSRSRSAEVQKGFRYGEPANQSEAQGNGTFIRTWQGFPLPVKESETVKYPTQTYYESTVYEIQTFSLVRLVINLIFWVGLITALLSPITIFWRPRKKTPVTAVAANDASSNEPQPTDTTAASQVNPHENTRH